MLKVEEGKSYQARSGRKVGPMRINRGEGLHHLCGPGPRGEGGASWYYVDTGTVYTNGIPEHPDDIVAEWVDKPSDADGWIDWDGGGPCPVADGTTVEVKFRDNETRGPYKNAQQGRWGHDGGGGDIVAYRVLRSAPESEPTVRGAASSHAAASLIIKAVDATVTKSRDDREGFIASPREVEAADILIINGVVVRDRTPGGRDELVRVIPRVPRISPADWLDLEQLSPGPVSVVHGPAAEGMSGMQALVIDPLVDKLLLADLLAALEECRDAETRRRADLKPGAPATQYTDDRLARINAAIAHATGRGIRAQGFAERERDLLEANNRYLEEARTARRQRDGAHNEIARYKVEVEDLNREADRLSAERNEWQDKALTAETNLDRVANRSDEERGMVWLVQQLGAHQRALAGVLPYAESRAEDMQESDAENLPEFEESPETVKAVAAVDTAKRLLGII